MDTREDDNGGDSGSKDDDDDPVWDGDVVTFCVLCCALWIGRMEMLAVQYMYYNRYLNLGKVFCYFNCNCRCMVLDGDYFLPVCL